MRLKVWKSLSTVIILAAITTIVLHFQVSEKSHDYTRDFQQIHRRAAASSVRDGPAAVTRAVSNYGDNFKGAQVDPVAKANKVERQQHDVGNLLQPDKEQSRGGFREMAWANDVPSLSDDTGSQATQNMSETEYQLRLLEKEINQFALKVQHAKQDLLSQSISEPAGRAKVNSEGQVNKPQADPNPGIDQAVPSLTVVVKDAPAAIKKPAIPSATTLDDTRRTELKDIFIAVKTTGKYHKSRLDILLDTWVALAKEETYFFTDVEDEEYKIRTNNHLINTNCSAQHSRQALCCKTAVIYDTFLKSEKRWFCGVDDDNYLNVKQLLNLLQDYKHEQDIYLGRASLSHPIEAMDRENKMQRVSFWFATGGAGFCISKSLALKMSVYARQGSFKSVCNRIRLPDDVAIGFIIEVLLKHPLTRINKFNSHLQSLRAIKAEHLTQQITLSYGIDEKRTNVVHLPPGYYNNTQDPTRFKSLHCLLFPTIGKCPNR